VTRTGVDLKADNKGQEIDSNDKVTKEEYKV
jgi:hypothetical protein